MLRAGTSSTTYKPQGKDVEVRLSTDTRSGGAHWEQARFVNRILRNTTPQSSVLRSEVGSLTLKVDELRRSMAEGQARTKELAAKLAAATREP
jgi:hypothetical protein